MRGERREGKSRPRHHGRPRRPLRRDGRGEQGDAEHQEPRPLLHPSNATMQDADRRGKCGRHRVKQCGSRRAGEQRQHERARHAQRRVSHRSWDAMRGRLKRVRPEVLPPQEGADRGGRRERKPDRALRGLGEREVIREYPPAQEDNAQSRFRPRTPTGDVQRQQRPRGEEPDTQGAAQHGSRPGDRHHQVPA